MSAAIVRSSRDLLQAGPEPRRERGTEIQLGHAVVEDEIPDRAGDLYLAFEHDIGAIDDIERLFDIVIGDQDTDAPMASTPAKGSSSSMNFGWVTSALVISSRRRSPPDSE
jgi:hypothetical protein